MPEAGSPPNGGTINVGDRVDFDLMVHAAGYTIAAQQAYLTFTSSLIQNVNASLTGCVLTSTVRSDNTIFDATLQNEVCNGPANCTFRGIPTSAGSFAFASGALNDPSYSGPDFRVAQVAFCATAPGTAILHWQFDPPDPVTRDTEIVDENSTLVQDRDCYVDFVINIAGSGGTATATRTSTTLPTGTSTPTNTPTDTPTNTPTATATPAVECTGAYHYWAPEAGSPPSGGTINVGDRIDLDLMVHTANSVITAQQVHLTFTSGLIQNVRASSTGCVLTSTVTPDLSIFDELILNEICNGPNPCIFRGVTHQPGEFGYASGAISNPPYNGPDFRVAHVAFCATAPGIAVLHWEFDPSISTHDTEILADDGSLVQDQACYADYVVNIVGAVRP